MGLSRNKVAVSEGAAGSPPFYGECGIGQTTLCRNSTGEIPRETVVQFSGIQEVGLTNAGGPPVPIPNTEVKPCSAEDTLLETARENRSRPTSFPLRKRGERKSLRTRTLHGGVAQLGEHLPCKQGVMGSNPIISTIDEKSSNQVETAKETA